MSFNIITSPIAKKVHRCVYCWTKIEIGEKYTRTKCMYEGDFQDHAWHSECLAEWEIDARDNDYEIFSGECRRSFVNPGINI